MGCPRTTMETRSLGCLVLLSLALSVNAQALGNSGFTVSGLVGLIIGVIGGTIIILIIVCIVMAACQGGRCRIGSKSSGSRVGVVNNTSATANASNVATSNNHAGHSNYTNNSNTGNTIIVMVPPQGGQGQPQAQPYTQSQAQSRVYPPPQDPAYPPPAYDSMGKAF